MNRMYSISLCLLCMSVTCSVFQIYKHMDTHAIDDSSEMNFANIHTNQCEVSYLRWCILLAWERKFHQINKSRSTEVTGVLDGEKENRREKSERETKRRRRMQEKKWRKVYVSTSTVVQVDEVQPFSRCCQQKKRVQIGAESVSFSTVQCVQAWYWLVGKQASKQASKCKVRASRTRCT